ncbi:MAG: tRNA preQ1(34) S-adenosylmethionine ribosyltransferase-isomerase QueA [Phycisphaeraceae bacterium]|nr:tRNA preQ1(34) S-adenosylmethionine ribosyltransferase-isomerase QueA [Phycisphaeraceae bacterium]
MAALVAAVIASLSAAITSAVVADIAALVAAANAIIALIAAPISAVMHRTRTPTSQLDYSLDPERIAREPVTPRDSARMMVVHRDADRVDHRTVRDLPDYLGAGDLIVINRTRVLAARLKFRRERDGKSFEGLLDAPLGGRSWRARIKHSKRLNPGDRLRVEPPGELDPHAQPQAQRRASPDATVVIEGPDADCTAIRFEGDEPIDELVERCGWTPLPPYIHRARQADHRPDDGAIDRLDRERYQTVYARPDGHGSIAAPTAGLHFTPELLEALRDRGATFADVQLQVGAGTFKPVETEFVDDHPIHSEWIHIPGETLDALAAKEPSRREGRGRVVAVGTTSVRTLESLPWPPDEAWLTAGWSTESSLMILPETPIRRVDALLTNFHLPRSSLLALVAAFVGLERLHRLYAEAQRERYRFFSFGDAMLIL